MAVVSFMLYFTVIVFDSLQFKTCKYHFEFWAPMYIKEIWLLEVRNLNFDKFLQSYYT